MNEHHKVLVVKIEELLPHTNADTLAIIQPLGSYQVVVKKDDYKVGELAIYIPPDTIVPAIPQFNFLWADREFTGEVPEKYRRITVRRFRKEWSEGLLMPLSDFGTEIKNTGYRIKAPEAAKMLLSSPWQSGQSSFAYVTEGDDVAELLGFKHYVEPDPTYVLGTPGRKLTLWQKILKFFGYAPKPFGPKNAPGVYDLESIKNYPRVFESGEPVIVTEKIHGSNARYLFDGKTFWVGSHKKWWKDKTNIWWRVAQKYSWIEAVCREWPGATLRGEVTPTQTGYQYGDSPEERFFVFDLQRPDGSYLDKSTLYKYPDIQQLVPVVYKGPYDAARIKALAEGNSLVDGAKHIREGVVVSSAAEREVRGLGRAILKLKSLKFLEKETGK